MKTTLSIITAGLVSGAAYGGDWGTEFSHQMREREFQAQVREQLEEIQAAQRQQEYEIYNRQLWEQSRIQRENYLRQCLEDCE